MAVIHIREAAEQDTAEIMRFIRELAQFEQLEHEVTATEEIIRASLFGKRPYAYALLAQVDGVSAGFCIYFYNFSTFVGKPGIYIEDIYVAPDYRKLGIGKRIFAKIGEIAKYNNCGRIEWWVLDWNRNAIDFYERLGAQAMSEWTVYRLSENKFEALLQNT